jgi:predicted permease
MVNFKAGLRALLRTPSFTAVAVLTLAIGIAANAALFSVYDRLVLSPVTVPDASHLVALWSNNPRINFYAPFVSWTRFQELQRHAHSFSSLGVSAADTFTLTGNNQAPDQLTGQRVSGEFFRTLGILPVRGRDFAPSDDVPHGPNVCIISDALWTSRFGRRESLVGSVIQLNNQSWEVVGILPPELTAPFQQVQVFAPRVFEISLLTPAQVESGAGYSQPIARLARGVSLEQAQAELRALGATYKEQFGGKIDADNPAEAREFTDSIVGNLKPTFYTLLGAVAFVLLIACANVASLFIGRLNARHKEIAVRESLGATRGAVVRQFLTESVLFTAVAGLVGALLARLSLSGLRLVVASQVPPNTVFALNWSAWAFIAGATLVSAILVGLAPAMQASRAQLVDVLKDAARGSSTARGGRVRSILIVVEVAMSVVLLVGSSLLVLSFLTLQRTPPGFDPTRVATALVGLPPGTYPTKAQQADFFERVLDGLRAAPQVADASASLGLPVNGFGVRSTYTLLGQPVLPLSQRPLANLQVVSEDYFATLRIPIVQGRAFTPQDRAGAPGVCVVNQSLATRLFHADSAIGRVLLRGPNAELPFTIVGVIADVKANGLNVPVPDEMYYPLRQLVQPGMQVTARTTGDPAALQGVIRAAVAAIDPNQPISSFTTLDAALATSLGVQRIVSSLTGCFAGIALLLAAVGLYSVVAHAVAQRTGEIGIRMALGAAPRQVLSLVMAGGLKLVAIGLALGVAGAAGAARLMQSLLASVGPFDPRIYAAVVALFTAVAALACLVPARRASRIDPLAALGDRVGMK